MFWIIGFIVIFFAVIVPIAGATKEIQDLKTQCKLLNTQNKALQVRCATLEKYKQFAKYAQVADAKATAEYILQKANTEAQRILLDTQQKAREFAGDALDARDNAKLYEQTVKAMKNIILGYGSDYLIPSRTLLDDLADTYGYSQASKDYKAVRSRVKNMIKNNQAVTCDYAEASRKQTAINFITDAFNGKAETILAKAKADNFGTLRQKLSDAFSLVNYNGRAFKNARITDEYFQLRLEELRLACVIAEFRRQDLEEQRSIREQMREEEKARKDAEKALREGAKEEDLLQKAMKKVKAQLEKANAEQKAVYEAKIEELEQKYHEAEERNKRALSMAQQTKAGHVYIISNEGSFGPNVFKIGMTRRLDPEDRVRELSSASVPFPFEIYAMIWSEDAPALENMLHKKFALAQVNKVNSRKEFFRLPLSEIRSELEAVSLNVKWTIAAEASEYHESLAIEKSFQDNEQARENWLNHQLDINAHRVFSPNYEDEQDEDNDTDN